MNEQCDHAQPVCTFCVSNQVKAILFSLHWITSCLRTLFMQPAHSVILALELFIYLFLLSFPAQKLLYVCMCVFVCMCDHCETSPVWTIPLELLRPANSFFPRQHLQWKTYHPSMFTLLKNNWLWLYAEYKSMWVKWLGNTLFGLSAYRQLCVCKNTCLLMWMLLQHWLWNVCRCD